MRIGVTDCLREDKLRLYIEWIKEHDPSVDLRKLSPVKGNVKEIDDVDGLLLTGGDDVDPEIYGKAELRTQCKGMNRTRDEFEIEVIKRALEADKPILGVCRGMQVMNVALGGTLHGDVEASGFRAHTSHSATPMKHEIEIEPNSLLSGLAGGLRQSVNSYHHQAVDALGKGLMKAAQSEDGIIEAAEWSSKEGMSFLLLVQWHPERTIEGGEKFSANLAKIFLREVDYSITNKATNTSRG
jgi:putative glutamine amidotransferase